LRTDSLRKSKKPKKGSKKSSKRERRARSELDRLWRSGRYWEWLEAVEASDLTGEVPEQWLEAWKGLCRRAFRQPEDLRELWERRRAFRSFPDFPDLHLLLLVEGFVDGREVRDEISRLHGLSLPAQALRDRVLSRDEGKGFPEEKARQALKACAAQPEKVTKRLYSDLASLLATRAGPSPFDQTLRVLAECFGQIRSLKSTAAAKTGRARRDPFLLERLDNALERATGHLAPTLRSILLRPFVFRACRFFTDLARAGETKVLAEIGSSAPFLFSLAAGDHAKELREQLLHIHPENLSIRDTTLLPDRVSSASLEEKLVLLARLRGSARRRLAEVIEEVPRFWEDPEDVAGDELLSFFRFLYEQVLTELAGRQPGLSQRERLHLARVADPIIGRDLHILAAGGREEELAEILRLCAGAGCLGPRLAVVALMVAERVRNRDLALRAEVVLRDTSPPTREQVLQALDEFPHLYFPYVGAVKPLIALLQDAESLISDLGFRFAHQTEALFYLTTAMDRDAGPLATLMRETASQISRGDLKILRREVKRYHDHPAFALLNDYLRCFPDGRLTQEGYVCLAKAVYEREGDLSFLLERLDELASDATPVTSPLPRALDPLPLREIVKLQHDGLLEFLLDHWSVVQELPLSTVQHLVGLSSKKKSLSPLEQRLLVKLSNLLADTSSGPEADEATRIRREIVEILYRLRKRRSGPERRRWR
jgi:hypothetical protein